ncbi:gliding motility lipoprotein GldB [Flavobacterium sp.]|uniref:gliding motility lipoprotein GldB n=1 Tax=Flavobacterium sp. TaxID=239 RepID=UPI002B4AF9F3|nr:gliding motility lipoprotein GldB [Flavobacterium sp.]HLF51533.1 gliding motility lipoprotein GldB [Flavobacterium sp.]
MKKYLLPFALCLLFASCDKKNKTEKEIENIPLEIKVVRFDKIFFETPVSELPKIKKQFPILFPEEVQDSVWINKMKNPLWRELYTEVQKKYSNFEPETQEIEDLFRHIKFYFPKTKTPKVITLINEMDYNTKAVYADSLVLISLELYLGKEHKFYEFPEYLKQNFGKNQMMPDIVSSFAIRKIPPPMDKTLLSQMVYAGKELYLKDVLLPEHTDADKIGYTPEQIKWCQENEGYMWRYFIEEKLLYNADSKLPNRFINVAPFSKFYLEIDNESPGRVGTWVGWQIVRSFMKNNEVSLPQLLQMDATEIFNKSKYKPQK